MPLEESQQAARPAPPCVMVIFGAAGDLTQRKPIPSLYHLSSSGLLPSSFAVVGVDRRERTSESFREHLSEGCAEHIHGDVMPETWAALVDRCYYFQADFGDGPACERPQAFLRDVDAKEGTPGSYLFYMAVPPRFFGEITGHLGTAGLTLEGEEQWRRVVIEKPFGSDLESARQLNRDLHRTLEEGQIYRIDHYLGKETVENIMVFRFANGFAEPMWNNRYIDQVQITVAESVGVGHRAGYYEHAGALRDMIPNHLLVLLEFIAMEPPNSSEAETVRDEALKVLRAVQPMQPEDGLVHAVRGQYGEGLTPEGQPVPGYRASPGVDPQSKVETFVALQLDIDNWRWAGVPFYLRPGKSLPAHYSEVAIYYRQALCILFRDTPVEHLATNTLVLRIQPNEGIELSFGAKLPGPAMRLGKVEMDFCYADYFGDAPSTGYETLIYDCMNGDATLFKHADGVEQGWSIVEPILDVWTALPPRDFPNYAAGTWGPKAAGELLRRDGRQWRRIRG